MLRIKKRLKIKLSKCSELVRFNLINMNEVEIISICKKHDNEEGAKEEVRNILGRSLNVLEAGTVGVEFINHKLKERSGIGGKLQEDRIRKMVENNVLGNYDLLV